MRHYSLPILALGAVLAMLYFGRVFFITAITAVIVSFILEPFFRRLVRWRLPRSLAAGVALSVAGLVVYAAGLGIYTQTASLVAQMPQFSEHVVGVVDAAQQRINGIDQAIYKAFARQQPPASMPKVSQKRRAVTAGPPPIQEVRIHQDSNPVMDYVYPRLGGLYEFILMASFVPFLVYFMLSWGEHVNRTFLQLFREEDRPVAAKSLAGVGEMVRAFVVGNFVLGAMLAVVSAVTFWMISVPFPLLSGVLSGFLSLIPYVGLPLALIPPVLTALGGSSDLTGVLIIVVIVSALHLVALNLLYPKVVGARVHLNPLVVTFAIMFWGFFWDAAGLLLAIPITAGIKAVCDNVEGLRKYGKFLGD